MAAVVPVAKGNALLENLAVEERRRLLAKSEQVSLALRDIIMEVGESIEHVFFPLSGVISLVTPMVDGSIVEVTTVGNEGLVGAPAFLDAESATVRAISQVPGEALKMPVGAFREEVARLEGLHRLTQRYLQALFTQVAQAAGCNRLHSNEERCSRWLLMTHDRVGSDEFPMTQEFLSQMLGVRRATVTLIAGALQQAGLIRYGRGVIKVLDREGLEAASCECYEVMKSELDRVVT